MLPDHVPLRPFTVAERVHHSSEFWSEQRARSLAPMVFNNEMKNAAVGATLRGSLVVQIDQASGDGRKIVDLHSLITYTGHLPAEGTSARKAYEEFQMSMCPHGPGQITWRQHSEDTLKMMYVAIQKTPDSRILKCGVLSNAKKHGANISRHYETMTSNLLSLILFCNATDTWSSNLVNLTKLEDLKQGSCAIMEPMSPQAQQDIFYNFVSPLLALAVEFMNPEESFTYLVTLKKSVKGSITDSIGKAQTNGVWVSHRVVARIQAGSINQSDSSLCQGVEFGFYNLMMKLGSSSIRNKAAFKRGDGYKLVEDDDIAINHDINENGVTLTSMVRNRPE
jgi:hypothetical protein